MAFDILIKIEFTEIIFSLLDVVQRILRISVICVIFYSTVIKWLFWLSKRKYISEWIINHKLVVFIPPVIKLQIRCSKRWSLWSTEFISSPFSISLGSTLVTVSEKVGMIWHDHHFEKRSVSSNPLETMRCDLCVGTIFDGLRKALSINYHSLKLWTTCGVVFMLFFLRCHELASPPQSDNRKSRLPEKSTITRFPWPENKHRNHTFSFPCTRGCTETLGTLPSRKFSTKFPNIWIRALLIVDHNTYFI